MAEFSFDGPGNGEQSTSVENSGTGDAFGGVALPGSGGSDGDTDSNGTVFDPAIHAGRDKFNSDGSYRKRRGRKPGSAGPASASNRPKARADYSASVDALSSTLLIVHAGLSSFTKVEELKIDKSDGDALAAALANVLQHFDIAPDPKIQAIVGLVTTAGMIYGPRWYLYNERVKAAKKKPATLHVLNPGGASVPIDGESIS